MTESRAPVRTKGLPPAAPRELGFSPERLSRIQQALQREIDAGILRGAVLFVARRGKVAFTTCLNAHDGSSGARLQEDAIFRITSLSKPIVSAAVMSFWEEGAFDLNDYIFTYLPELADLKVANQELRTAKFEDIELVPAVHQPTIKELLTHTAGLTHCISDDGIARLYRQAGVSSTNQSLAEMVSKLGTFPLLNQPGTVWKYGHATDVLGRLLEVIVGKTLDCVLEERILKPLGMKDTGFYVPEEKLDRLFDCDSGNAETHSTSNSGVTTPPKLLDPGGGLFSTASDYLRFLQMLLNGGSLDDQRVLGPRTVEYMMLNHLGSICPQKTAAPGSVLLIPEPGYGMGLGGFSVRLVKNEAAFPGSVGSYYWHGSRGTMAAVDPHEELAVSYMATYTTGEARSLTMAEAMVHSLHQTICLIYQAIED